MATVKIPSQKVILCGEYGVGKSSLFRRFAMDTFVSASDRKSTLGLDQFEKAYSVGPEQRQIKVSSQNAGSLVDVECLIFDSLRHNSWMKLYCFTNIYN